jgi:hypothetical protein
MPTINTTVFLNEAYVLVEVDWTDYPQVLYAGVTRRNTVTGEVVTLRPYTAYDSNGNLLLSCGLGLWWDTEPPLNVPLEYCTFAAPVDTLLTQNDDFETALAPWAGSNGVAVRSNTFAHQGTWSAELTPTGGLTNGQIFNGTDTGPFTVGQPLIMQGWAMSPQGWNSVELLAGIIYDDGEQTSFSTETEILDDGEWRFLQTEFTPTKPGVIGSMTFIIYGIVPATTIFYLDQVGVYQKQDVGVTACETVTVASEAIWLKSPLYPCSDVSLGLCNPAMDFDCEEDSRVTYVGMAEDILNANTVLSEPTNRVHPIPVSRTRRAPRSELRVLAHDCDARDAVLLVNNPGTPLLFQAPVDYCIPDRYISVGPVAEARFSVDQRDDFRLMLMPYAVVQRPEGPANGICGARIEDLCDIYTSWQAMILAGLTYYDLLLGLASDDGPFSPPFDDLRIWDEVLTEFANWTAVEAGGTRDWDELRNGL